MPIGAGGSASREDAGVKGLVVDIGGVLTDAALWLDTIDGLAARLGLDRSVLLSAIYGGSDDTVLIGQMPEDTWWDVVGSRLGIGPAEVLRDLQVTERWDNALVAELRVAKRHCRTALLSNAWPSQRTRMESLIQGPIREVIDRCLSVDPTGRYGSVHELAAALRLLRRQRRAWAMENDANVTV